MDWRIFMKNKLNNKGFTLVELLAVFVILLSVSFVAVGGITASLENRDIKECEEQQEMAVSAAKMYFSLDGKDINQVDVGVKVSVLKANGYIDEADEADRLNDDDTIKIKADYSGYTYNGKSVGCSCSNSCG